MTLLAPAPTKWGQDPLPDYALVERASIRCQTVGDSMLSGFECAHPLFPPKRGWWHRLKHGTTTTGEPGKGLVARDVAWLFGTSQGAEFWLSIERPLNVIGPARSGKGVHIVVNAILDAPGAVITSSTRVSHSKREVDGLTPDELRRLPFGVAAVLEGNMNIAVVDMIPYWKSRHQTCIQKSKQWHDQNPGQVVASTIRRKASR